ncbi:hypothetical protein BX600DRAFT_72850 [Xylariales sp. PMI_506]|nr:hypothetical protein BX600DRAFT_72850 [Xylariales sp. PMI_506]
MSILHQPSSLDQTSCTMTRLTELNVGKLESLTRGSSPFTSESEDSVISNNTYLRRAKDSIYAAMAALRTVGSAGQQILKQDELYIAGHNYIRVRRGTTAYSLEDSTYLAMKLEYFMSAYKNIQMTDSTHHQPRIDKDSQAQIEQDANDNFVRAWEKKKGYVREWMANSPPVSASKSRDGRDNDFPHRHRNIRKLGGSTKETKRSAVLIESKVSKSQYKQFRENSRPSSKVNADTEHFYTRLQGDVPDTRKPRASLRVRNEIQIYKERLPGHVVRDRRISKPRRTQPQTAPGPRRSTRVSKRPERWIDMLT